MAEIMITTDDKRPRNIAIGIAVVAVITWWQVTGSLPLLASTLFESPDSSGKLSSVQSFLIELASDGLYLIGVFVTSVFSGIWSLGVSLIGRLVESSKKPAEPTAQSWQESLDAQTQKIFQAVETPLNEIDARVEALEFKVNQEVEAPKPVRVARKRTPKISGVNS
jgi:hypothetical protein